MCRYRSYYGSAELDCIGEYKFVTELQVGVHFVVITYGNCRSFIYFQYAVDNGGHLAEAGDTGSGVRRRSWEARDTIDYVMSWSGHCSPGREGGRHGTGGFTRIMGTAKVKCNYLINDKSWFILVTVHCWKHMCVDLKRVIPPPSEGSNKHTKWVRIKVVLWYSISLRRLIKSLIVQLTESEHGAWALYCHSSIARSAGLYLMSNAMVISEHCTVYNLLLMQMLWSDGTRRAATDIYWRQEWRIQQYGGYSHTQRCDDNIHIEVRHVIRTIKASGSEVLGAGGMKSYTCKGVALTARLYTHDKLTMAVSKLGSYHSCCKLYCLHKTVPSLLCGRQFSSADSVRCLVAVVLICAQYKLCPRDCGLGSRSAPVHCVRKGGMTDNLCVKQAIHVGYMVNNFRVYEGMCVRVGRHQTEPRRTLWEGV